jgi:Asp-tRNA(Asn)/Glu-tRNA(Gln) amidotransferase A subunit family amidase
LAGLGAKLVEIEIPHLETTRVGHVITIASEMLASLNEVYRKTPDKFSLEVRTNLGLAAAFSAADYVRAQRARTRAIAAFSSALAQVDVIATPTTAITAPLIPADALALGESDLTTLTEIMRYAVAANFTGLPAISLPAGRDIAGLPIGLQLIGSAWSEALLLRLANAAEQLGERHPPALLYQPAFQKNI